MAERKAGKEKAAASLVIHSPGAMTEEGRKQIADWLRRQAKSLVKDGKDYTTGRFSARWFYEV